MSSNQFYPRLAYINAVTNAQQAVVTFTADHDFTLGEIVSFRCSSQFGMVQINNLKGKVVAKTDDTITVDIDTTNWDAFDYSVLNNAGTTPPVCVPCCSGVVPGSNPSATNLLDTFDNRRV